MIPTPQTSVINAARQAKQLGLERARRGEFREAAALLSEAATLDPQSAHLRVNLAIVLHELGEYEKAREELDVANKLEPARPEIFSNLCLTLTELHQFGRAIECAQAALKLRPQYPEAWNNLGAAQHRAGNLDGAVASYRTATEVRPNYAKAWANMGVALQELGRLVEARDCLARAMKTDPRIPNLRGALLHLQMRLCDWQAFEESKRHLVEAIEAGEPTCPPFAVLALVDSPPIHRRCAAIYAARYRHATHPIGNPTPRRTGQKIRLGYFSADYFNHATTHLIHGVIAAHDRERFEVIAYSLGPARDDVEARRVLRLFDHVHEIHSLSDQAILELCKMHELDIAVDLKGYTQDSRPGIFAARAAPIQVSFLGYPGTLALPQMDYLIADRTLITSDSRAFFDERVVLMPGTYQCNSERRPDDITPTDRTSEGLPENGVVFCCFNNTYKITPDVFAIWVSILQQVAGSVLWLLSDNPEAERNLRHHASALGVDPSRLIFAKRVSPREHLHRHTLADLFLDTTPYNAHTTASDALRMGVPIVTIAGRSFPARVAASLLYALNLPELVAKDLNHYRALGVHLATDAKRLSTIRDQIEKAVNTSSVFDPAAYASDLERAYISMMKTHREGHPPQDIEL